MANVFISYASEDLVLGQQVSRWIMDDHHEVFLAQDGHDSIPAGDAWRSRLYERHELRAGRSVNT